MPGRAVRRQDVGGVAIRNHASNRLGFSLRAEYGVRHPIARAFPSSSRNSWRVRPVATAMLPSATCSTCIERDKEFPLSPEDRGRIRRVIVESAPACSGTTSSSTGFTSRLQVRQSPRDRSHSVRDLEPAGGSSRSRRSPSGRCRRTDDDLVGELSAAGASKRASCVLAATADEARLDAPARPNSSLTRSCVMVTLTRWASPTMRTTSTVRGCDSFARGSSYSVRAINQCR